MRRVRYAILTVALLSTGVYLFVYLYRWEWHRALVAGVLFVAAEVGLAASAILDRLRSIESRLQEGPAIVPGVAQPGPLARVREAAPEPRTNFDWLSRQSGEMSVFVPLLLGAGVVLSAAAWVVERLARASAGPSLERDLASRLVPLSLPAGTLTGTAARPVRERRSPVPHLVAAAGAVAVATLGLDAMADATQNRPDPRLPGTTSSVLVSIDSRPARPTLDATRALWGACTTQLGGGHRVLGMSEMGSGQVEVLVRPQIGKHAERRLRGCIGDATTDKISAGVASITPLSRGTAAER